MSDARSDNDLVLAWARGDARAFDTLYERYRGPLYRYLFHALGDRALADDAYQDTWSSIVEARDRFEPRTEFRRWAFRIAHNRLVDHWRRTGRRPQESDAGLDELPHASVPDAEAERDEDARRLRRALQQLPAEQREAFLLQQEAGLTLADIAARDGVGRETIKSRLRYATAKLRGLLSANPLGATERGPPTTRGAEPEATTKNER